MRDGTFKAVHEHDFLLFASQGKLADIKELLKKYKIDINFVDGNKSNALINATYNNHKETVRFLLKLGVNVNQQEYNGMTALMHLVNKFRVDEKLVKEFIKYDIDYTLKDNDEKTVFDYDQRGVLKAELSKKKKLSKFADFLEL
jgi:ankyrin repeat protein